MKVNMLKAYLALNGTNQTKMAKSLGISCAAFMNKMAGRSEFTRKEIGAMIHLLDIKDPVAIFFDEEYPKGNEQ